MARRRAATTSTVRPIVIAAPAPIVRRSRSRAPAKRRRRSSARRTHTVGSTPLRNRMIGVGVGGLVVGFIEKNWGAQLPSIPFLGRKGSIAIAAYFLAPKAAWIQDVGVAAAALSGYDLGKTGAISGLDVMGDDDMLAAQT